VDVAEMQITIRASVLLFQVPMFQGFMALSFALGHNPETLVNDTTIYTLSWFIAAFYSKAGLGVKKHEFVRNP